MAEYVNQALDLVEGFIFKHAPGVVTGVPSEYDQPFVMFTLAFSTVMFIGLMGLRAKWTSSPPEKASLSSAWVKANTVYNIVQVVLCGFMTLGLGRAIWWQMISSDFVHPDPVRTSGGAQVASIPAMWRFFGLGYPQTAAGTMWLRVHLLSKYLDFFDAILICLTKYSRKLSFLLVWHHASILAVWVYACFMTDSGCVIFFGACVNSFIHVLMYGYLQFSNWLRPFKMLVTLAQMMQFAIILTVSISVARYDTATEQQAAYVQASYHVGMLLLFGNFSMIEYFGKDKKKSSKGKKAVKAE